MNNTLDTRAIAKQGLGSTQFIKAIMLSTALFSLLCINSNTYGQDHHFSMYDASPMTYNPAATGLMASDFRVVTQFRTQWSSISSRFLSNVLAYDMHTKDKWSFGGILQNHGGPNYLNEFTCLLSSAYEITNKSTGKYSLRVGLQAGIIYKSLKPNALLFDNQWFEGTFNDDVPSYENLVRKSMAMLDINYGVAYTSINSDKRLNPYGGFSMFHITAPKQSFNKVDDSRLPRRFVLNGGTKIKLIDRFSADVKALAMWQGQASEYSAGLHLKYNVTDDISAMLGTQLRINDAVVIMAGVSHKNIIYRFAYDINTSGLKSFSSGRGALELGIVFMPPAPTRSKVDY